MFNFNVETIVLVLAQIGLDDLRSCGQYLFLHLIDLRKLAVLPCFALLGKVSTPFFKASALDAMPPSSYQNAAFHSVAEILLLVRSKLPQTTTDIPPD